MLVSFNQRAHLTQFNMIGSGPGKANEWGETGFMLACMNGHKDVVKLLLDNSKDAKGKSGQNSFIDFNVKDFLTVLVVPKLHVQILQKKYDQDLPYRQPW